MKLPTVIILAGGYGSRISHLSGNLPKALLDINGTPFLEIKLKQLFNIGFENIIICVGIKGEQIIDFIEKSDFAKLKITVIADGACQLGTGGAINNAIEQVEEEFFVTYGDSYLEFDYLDFYQFAKQKQCCMTIYENQNKLGVSNVKKLNNDLIKYEKLRTNSNFNYIDFGFIYFKTKVYKEFYNLRLTDLSDLLTKISDANLLHGYEVKNQFYEIGSERGLIELRNYLRK